MSVPKTVEAIAIDKQGDLDVIELKTLPFEQGPKDFVVKVIWGGVNMIDTYFRKGIYPVKAFPQILGAEAAGVIVKLPTDESVLNDEAFKRRGYRVGMKVLVSALGTFATYVSWPWASTYPVPDSVPLDIASGCISHCLTAITTMTESHNVQPGETIFVHTVAGGLGLAFTAYAKSRGAIVIGTTSSPEKAALAKSYGADHVILYNKENVVERTLELTIGEGVHAVFDGVGKDTFLANFDILRRKGTLVAIGNASGPPDPVSPLKLSPKNLKLVRPSMYNYITTPDEADPYLKEMWDGVESGLFKVRIEKIFPFTAEGVREAQREISTPGNKIAGKMLLKIADDEK